jgi:hypothetical protein
MNEPTIKLEIKFYTEGRLEVNGIPDNRILCYGILKTAEKCIDAHYAKTQEDSRIVPVTLPPS